MTEEHFPYPDNINNDNKRQLMHLESVTRSLNEEIFNHRIFANLRLLNVARAGGTIFSPEEELNIALSSLGQNDDEIKDQFQCGRSTLSYIRNRVISAYWDTLPSDFTDMIELTQNQLIHVNFLKNKREELRIDAAYKIAVDDSNHPVVRNFFGTYYRDISICPLMEQFGVEIDAKLRHQMDRSVKLFLSPEIDFGSGFQKILKHYIAGTVLENHECLKEVSYAISLLRDLKFRGKDPAFQSFTRIRIATNHMDGKQIVNSIRRMCEHTLSGESQTNLHYTDQEIIRYVNNYFLVDNSIPDRNIEALKYSPNELIFMLRDRSLT